MKSVYVILCCLACAQAKPPVFLGYQDSFGQYSFGYSAPGSARSEIRTLNGATRGAYSYVDETGAIHSAEYVADGEHGFRVVATNLPQAPLPVQDTAEVVAARAAHLQAVELAKKAEESGEEGNKLQTKNVFLQENQPAKEGEVKAEEKEQTIQENVEKVAAKSVENVKPEEQKEVEQETIKGDPKNSAEIIAAKSSQGIISDGQIAAIPITASHLVIKPPVVPIFRVSQGNLEIDPASIKESLEINDSAGTPANTALKIGQEAIKIEAKQAEEAKPQENANIITPINIPVNSYSSFIRYIPSPVHYITYNVL